MKQSESNVELSGGQYSCIHPNLMLQRWPDDDNQPHEQGQPKFFFHTIDFL